jgi:hypothetical protein
MSYIDDSKLNFEIWLRFGFGFLDFRDRNIVLRFF